MRNIIRRAFGTSAGLPKFIDIKGVGKVPIVLEPLSEEQWGLFDPKRQRIVISDQIPDPLKHVVLMHQVLDMTKNLLEVSSLKDFLQQSPMVLLHILTEAGLYTGVKAEEVSRFIDEQADSMSRGKR